VGIGGTDSGRFKAWEGDEMMSVSAICHDLGLGYV
jgi:hypothetical protein